MTLKYDDLDYNRGQIEKFYKEGKYFRGETCSRCGLRYNILSNIKTLECQCGSLIALSSRHIHDPYNSPDYGPAQSLINYATSTGEQVPYSS